MCSQPIFSTPAGNSRADPTTALPLLPPRSSHPRLVHQEAHPQLHLATLGALQPHPARQAARRAAGPPALHHRPHRQREPAQEVVRLEKVAVPHLQRGRRWPSAATCHSRHRLQQGDRPASILRGDDAPVPAGTVQAAAGRATAGLVRKQLPRHTRTALPAARCAGRQTGAHLQLQLLRRGHLEEFKGAVESRGAAVERHQRAPLLLAHLRGGSTGANVCRCWQPAGLAPSGTYTMPRLAQAAA